MEKTDVLESLKKLRKEEKKKFEQSVDLIINLKNFDIKKDSLNLFVELPHKVKDVRIGAFLNEKSGVVDSITKSNFGKYKDKKQVKKLLKTYDYFIASAALMPAVATSFGRYLGPVGKMPSPKLGIIKSEKDDEIKKIVDKFGKIARVRSKEPSLKFCIGKENMKDEEISENVVAAYNNIINNLPRKKENVKSVMIKFTMGKPIKIKF